MYSPQPCRGALMSKKLSDEFAQYTLVLTCGSCLRERRTTPHLLAKLCGWDAKLEDVLHASEMAQEIFMCETPRLLDCSTALRLSADTKVIERTAAAKSL